MQVPAGDTRWDCCRSVLILDMVFNGPPTAVECCTIKGCSHVQCGRFRLLARFKIKMHFHCLYFDFELSKLPESGSNWFSDCVPQSVLEL